MARQVPPRRFDEPWKEALDRFLPRALELLAPEVHRGIDWARGFTPLDKELRQAMRGARLGARHADKLYAVTLVDGTETRVFLHVEVQNQPDRRFEERMFVYLLRIFEARRAPVVGIAILGDTAAGWRPDQYAYELLGASVRYRFVSVKLLDWLDRTAELEQSDNPFAWFVLAHLKAQTERDPESALYWKTHLVRALLCRKLAHDQVEQLLRFLDWLMVLPDELEQQFARIAEMLEESTMSFESPLLQYLQKRGHELGLKEGIEKGVEQACRKAILEVLEVRFGPPTDGLRARIDRIEATADLERLLRLAVLVPDLEAFARELAPE